MHERRQCIGHPLAMGRGSCGFVGLLYLPPGESPVCPTCGGWTDPAAPEPVEAKQPDESLDWASFDAERGSWG